MVGSVERTMYFEFYVSIGLFISKKILTQEGRGDSEGKAVVCRWSKNPEVLQDKKATCGMYN